MALRPLGALVLTLLLGHAATADDAERVCSHALQLQRSGALTDAIAEYQACLALRPKDLAMRSNLGAALAAAGRLPEAIDTYQQALAISDNPALRRNLAVTYFQARDYASAIATLQPLEASKDLDITLLLADCRLRLGQNQKVIDALTPLELDPREPKAIAYLLGTALVRHGNEARGQQLLSRQSLPDTAQTRFAAAKLLFDQGNYPAAVAGFAKVIELDAGLPSLQSFYGQALLFTGDPDGAETAFRQELQHQPNDFEANLKLGSILQFRHREAEALAYFQKAVSVQGDSLEARNGLAKVYAALERWDEARIQLETILRQVPNYRDGHLELAAVFEKLDRKKDASTQRELAGEPVTNPENDTGLLPVGAPAPGFTLGNITLAQLHEKPVLLVFGSYSCPQFRFDVPALNRLYDQYGTQVHFLLVYIHEAHTSADWRSTANQREGVELAPVASLEDKSKYAQLCKRKLAIRFDSVVDGLDRRVEQAYHAWPSAAYLIDTNGRIQLRSRLGEQETATKELERLLRGH